MILDDATITIGAAIFIFFHAVGLGAAWSNMRTKQSHTCEEIKLLRETINEINKKLGNGINQRLRKCEEGIAVLRSTKRQSVDRDFNN